MIARLAVAVISLTAVAATADTHIGPVYTHYGPDRAQEVWVYPHHPISDLEPAIVMIHGGGWSKGSAQGVAENAAKLAQLGYVIFNVDYPLDSADRAGYPMEANSVVVAVKWAIRHAREFGADPKRMNLLGGSAGATLAASVGVQMNSRSRVVSTVISLSGRMSFLHFERELGGSTADGFDPAVNIPLYLGCPLSSCSSQIEMNASPLTHVNKFCPAFLLLNSRHEHMPVAQARLMAEELYDHRCAVSVRIVPGTEHAFAYFDRVLPRLQRFLRSHGQDGR